MIRAARWWPVGQAAPFVLTVAALMAIPTAVLAWYSLRSSSFFGIGNDVTLDNYRAFIDDPVAMTLLRRTASIALGVAAMTTALALVVAYAMTFRLRGRAALVVLAVVVASSVASFLVRVLSWSMVLGSSGFANGGLEAFGLVDRPVEWIFYNWTSVVAVMVYVYLPLAVLLVYSAMQEIDQRSLQASRDLGAGRWRTLVRVVLPQARIGLLGAFLLVGVLAASDYIVPSLVGGRRGQTIGSSVYRQFTEASAYGGGAAFAIVSTLTVLALLCAVVAAVPATRPLRRRAAGGFDRAAGRIGALAPARFARASFSRPAAYAICGFLLMPTFLVLLFSLNSSSSLGLPFEGVTLDWYPTVVGRPGFGDALRTSLTVAAAATAIAVLIGVPAALALRRLGRVGHRVVMACVGLTFAIPPAMLGAGAFTVALERDLPLGPVLTTAMQVAFAAPVVVLVVHGRLANLDARIFEAARDLGAGPARVFRTITAPLLVPSVIGAAALGMAYALDEVVVTNYTIGSSSTVPTWLFSRARNAFTPEINALGVIMLVITLGLFAVALLAVREALAHSRSHEA